MYEAYTDPALVQRWLLGPPGWTMPVCEMDVRVEGSYRWRWRSDADGREFGLHGEFLEVEAPAMLKHTEIFDPGDVGGSMGDAVTTVTVRFTEREGRTQGRTLIDYGSDEARDAALATGMIDGMEKSYGRLDELLGERAGG